MIEEPPNDPSPMRWRWHCLMLSSAVIFYACIRTHEWALSVPISLFSLMLLTLSFYHVPLKLWILLILAFVPFEVSNPLWILPSLSPIDYFCAVALLTLIIRLKPRLFLARLQKSFCRPGCILLWVVFLSYGLMDAYWTRGDVRNVLRWGEFVFCYFLGMQAVEEGEMGLETATVQLLAFFGSIVSVIALLQFKRSCGDYTLAFATFGQHNGLGGFLSLCFPGCVCLVLSSKGGRRYIWIIPAVIVFCTFVLSHSRGAWLGIVVGAVWISTLYLFNRHKMQQWVSHYSTFLFITFFLLISIVFPLIWASSSARIASSYPEIASMRRSIQLQTGTKHSCRSYARSVIDSVILSIWPLTPGRPRNLDSPIGKLLDLSQRPLYWQAALSIIRCHPFIGLGPGNYPKELPRYLSGRGLELYQLDVRDYKQLNFWQHLHNSYLQVLVTYGSIGFVLWSVALLAMLQSAFIPLSTTRNTLVKGIQISVVAFLVHNTVDIMFVNSFDLIVAFMAAFLSHYPRA